MPGGRPAPPPPRPPRPHPSRGRSKPPSASRCLTCCTSSASGTPHRPACTPPCWTRGSAGVGVDDVPAAARPGRDRRPASACHPPGPRQARAAGDPAQPVLVVGHHQAGGPAKWTWYYLYVLLDIYSRYVVGWLVAHREAAALAERLLADTITVQGIDAGQLAVHADRGTSMTSKPVAMLLADLGVTSSHARPHVPDDNPTPRASSRLSSTIPASRTGSAPSRTPAPSARGSSAGTTRAPPQRDRAAHPGRRPPRSCQPGHHRPGGRPGWRLRPAP